MGLLESRSTPVDGFESPAKFLMSRKLRSTIPALPEHFKPEGIDDKSFRINRERIQLQQGLRRESS